MSVELSLVILAYLLGAVPTAYLLVRATTGEDIREKGTGNVGGTNALRFAGWKVGVAVTLIDMGKGALPVWLMKMYDPESVWLAAALVAAVLGHCYPVWLRFQGGKGVATGLGVFMVLAPASALVAIAVWVVILVIWRWVSLASMATSASFPLILKLIDQPDLVTLVAVSAVAVLIILRHGSNIRSLLEGTEVKVGGEHWR